MPLPSASAPFENHLLASLPAEVSERLQPFLEPCLLPLGKVLCESGAYINHLYFPTDSIVSLLNVTVGGDTAEISIVGKEGVVGVSQFLGGDSVHTRAVIQSAGGAYRLPTLVAMTEFNRHGEFMMRVLRYVQSLMTQMAQTALCNKHHSLEQQLCRWLLLSMDRLGSNQLLMTQQLIASMLGVRSEGVTKAAGKLQKRGVIEYTRGHIRVMNRAQLEELSCECYRVVKVETDRLLFFRGDYYPAPVLSDAQQNSA